MLDEDLARREPEGELRTQWFWQELGASVFSIALLALVATSVIPLRAFGIYLVVIAGVAVTASAKNCSAGVEIGRYFAPHSSRNGTSEK